MLQIEVYVADVAATAAILRASSAWK